MNDQILEAVRDSAAPVHMERPLEAIEARARALGRRRTLTGLAAVGLTAGLGVALALTVTGVTTTRPEGGAPASVAVPGEGAAPAEFTLVSASDGTVTISFGQIIADPVTLERALADVGITAIVRVNESCEGRSAPNPGLFEAVEVGRPGPDGEPTVIIRKATMPRDIAVVLGLGAREGRIESIRISFVAAGAPVTCTSLPAPR
jgi:hypothetical protein